MKGFVRCKDREEDGGCNAITLSARLSRNTSQQKETIAYCMSHIGVMRASRPQAVKLTIPHQAPKIAGELIAAGAGYKTYVKPSATKLNMIAVLWSSSCGVGV